MRPPIIPDGTPAHPETLYNPATHLALTPGSRLGSYEVLALLGAGGMGEVYRARDTKLNRDVAIKVLLPSVAGDPDRLARFSREAQVLASLNHPNIAHIHGIEESQGVTALIMELVEGEDLSQRISRGPIPLDEALPIARQIAEALEGAHDHGIIHRDLKPANIKVRPDGTVKVLDFGLAKAVDPSAGSSATAMNSPTLSIHATQAGIILGTAAYMSPEQARGKAVDKRTDIWALGCVLFEMLTGMRAFPGDDATDTIVAVVSKDPAWNALPANVPVGIRRLLRRSLEKDPKRRLDSAGGARIEIDEALSTPVVDTDTTRGSSSATRWLRLLPWGVAAALAAGLLASVMYQRPVPEERGVVRFKVQAPFGSIRRGNVNFAVSPDGKTIAFDSRGPDGIGRILTRRLDDAEPLVMAGTEGATAPFWSPDSRSIGFIRESTIFRSDLDGRAPVRVHNVAGRVSYATWGTRGVIVFATPTGLMRVPDTGGAQSPVSTLDASNNEVAHHAPFFLPDGLHVLFLALPSGAVRGTVWATSIDDPARTRVAESAGGAAYADGWLLTTTDRSRTLLAQLFDPQRLTTSGSPQPVRDGLGFGSSAGDPGFSLSAQGVLVSARPPPEVHQLTWMDRAGRVLATTGPASDIRAFSLSSDGLRVAANVIDAGSGATDLWVYEGQRQEGTRLTFQSVGNRPMWALDGRRVYFTGAPNFELRSLVIGATESQPFENTTGAISFEDLTRDGRYIVFRAPNNISIQRVGVSGERRIVVSPGQFNPLQPRVSPDSRWLAHTRGTPPEIYVQPFDRPGERIQVSRSGGIGAVWRTDGRELYFESAGALMAVAVTERDGALVLGVPQKLFAIRTQGNVPNQPHNFEVADNGQRFLVNTIVGDSDNAPLEVTLNWTAGLKK